MTPQERDQARYEMLSGLNERNSALLRQPGVNSHFISLINIDRDNQISRGLHNAHLFTERSYEEAIVVEIMGLVRASKLPHQAVLDAVTACLAQESSDRKNQARGANAKDRPEVAVLCAG